MRCPEWRESMSLKLDGLLPADQEARLAAHLDVCPACARVWQTWQEIDDLRPVTIPFGPP